MCLWEVQTTSQYSRCFCVRGNCLERNMSNESSDGKLVLLFKTVVLFLTFILLELVGPISGLPMEYA